MKAIWTIISIIALANLLALGGLIAWLASTQRLDMDRMGEIRELLATPTTEVEESEETESDASNDDAPLPPGVMPFAAAPSEIVASRLELSTIDEMRRDRLAREIEDIQRAHTLERARLDQEWEQLRSERESFETAAREARETDGAAQFRKAVEVLNQQRPADAVAMLQALMQQGIDVATDADPDMDPREAGRRQAISYINAMQARPRNALMAQFAKDQPELAAELLEGLRTRGLGAVAN